MQGSRLGLLALSFALLAGCIKRESFGSSYDLRWVGPVTPVAGRCPAASQGTMTMVARDRSVTFAPSDGVIVLRGNVAPDGTVHAGLDTLGADHRPFPLRLEASLSDAGVNGTYTTPICRERVELRSPQPLPRRLFAPGNLLGIGKP
jgi:hypothetical protein